MLEVHEDLEDLGIRLELVGCKGDSANLVEALVTGKSVFWCLPPLPIPRCHKAPGKVLTPIPPVDQEQAKALGENKKKKKKKKKKAKKVEVPGNTGGAAGGVTSSDSESESPTRADQVQLEPIESTLLPTGL